VEYVRHAPQDCGRGGGREEFGTGGADDVGRYVASERSWWNNLRMMLVVRSTSTLDSGAIVGGEGGEWK